jgi:HAD superfamily hydrolase (TIGR01549 family)
MHWIFLDAGHTLVEVNTVRIHQAVAPFGITINADAFRREEAHVRAELDRPEVIASTNDWDRFFTYFDRTLERLGHGTADLRRQCIDAIQAEHRKSNLWDAVYATTLPALHSLKELGAKLCVISNAQGDVVELMERLDLSPFFEAVIDSGDFGVEKPDPRIFDIAFERAGFTGAESAFYVGDIYHIDIVCARSAGLEAVLVDPYGLHEDKDCPRIRHLGELVELVKVVNRKL